MIRYLRARLRPSRAARPGSPWDEILERGVPERLANAAGTRVLCATSVGGHPVARAVDSLVAMALWLRGAEPTLLLCDGALPACEQCAYVEFPSPDEFVRTGPQGRLCGPCFGAGRSYYEPLPIPLRRYREYLDDGEAARAVEQAATFGLDECFSFERDGLRLGEQSRAGTLRFFGKADLTTEPADLVLATARRYAAGALVGAAVAERVFADLRPDCVVAHHGVYVPQGVLGEVARRDGIRVVNWGPAYRNTTAIYSHGDTYHRTFIDEPVEAWDERRLTAEEEDELLRYLAERRLGRGDWAWITPEAALRPDWQERDRLLAELELDPARPIFGLLTNVLWDAQLYYEGQVFADMLDWLWASIDHVASRPDHQLVIRIHPHEIKHGNRQPVLDEITRRYPELPANVRVVPPDHTFNTYALMGLCDAVLLYGTKTGVELAPLGQRVVVGGEAWARGKGFTYDVGSRDEYGSLLDDLAAAKEQRLDDEQVARARRYAFHYFFRRMIPVSSLDPDKGFPPEPAVESLDDLLPGRDPGLDVICDGILNGAPFEYEGPR